MALIGNGASLAYSARSLLEAFAATGGDLGSVANDPAVKVPVRAEVVVFGFRLFLLPGKVRWG